MAQPITVYIMLRISPFERPIPMRKILNSLQTSLIASFILLILVIAGGTLIFTYGQTKKALLEITRDDLHQMIAIASTQISPDEIQAVLKLQAGEDETPAYQALQKKFRDMRALSKNIVNFYIMRVEGS